MSNINKSGEATYRWLNEFSQQFLEKDYLLAGETVDDRVNVICNNAERILGIKGFAQQFKENFQKGWYSLSTPIWANFGTDRGLPISCFGSIIEDDMSSILFTQAEVGAMSKIGGGTSAYFGNLRPRGSSIKNNGQSSGSVHFMQLFNTMVDVISQGSSRKGSFAAYLPIDHGDIEEFLTIKSEGSPIQGISFGVTVTDKWMEGMIAGDPDKRKIWAKVLETRTNTGYPYIMFVDNANKGTSDVYKDKGMKIIDSNLCNEIMLPKSPTESFVCDLSSMNILYYDEWKNTNAVELMVYFLNAVMDEFLEKAQHIQFMERAVKFARRHRALGIGWLGWHSYLQSKMIAWESMEAKYANIEIAKFIYGRAYKGSREYAKQFGQPELLARSAWEKFLDKILLRKVKYYDHANTTLLALAPTKSSSFILGQASQGIEPFTSNYWIEDVAKGKFTIKNIHLEKLLKEKGRDNESVWQSILRNDGSVQHLDFLTENEKNVFKTFQEISPKEIIIQAAQRQKYVDQGQSLNLMIHPNIPIREVNALLIEGWRLGIKGYYYQKSSNMTQDFANSILNCTSCES